MHDFKTNLRRSLKHTNTTAVPLSDYGCKNWTMNRLNKTHKNS